MIKVKGEIEMINTELSTLNFEWHIDSGGEIESFYSLPPFKYSYKLSAEKKYENI